jgi:predicted nucleotidyltransferase
MVHYRPQPPLDGGQMGMGYRTAMDYTTNMVTPVREKQDLLKRLTDESARIKARGVRRLGLFGSFVRDEQGPRSDVDVLVEFQPGQKTFDNFMGLADLLEEILRRRVELVTTEGLSPYLGPRILADVEDVPLDD